VKACHAYRVYCIHHEKVEKVDYGFPNDEFVFSVEANVYDRLLAPRGHVRYGV
jgi:hypothetical protein